MSMLGNFRQVSPALLDRMKSNPSLIEKVVRWRPHTTTPRDDVEAFLSLLPTHMRKAVESMPAEARAGFLEQVAAGIANMPGIVKSQIAEARSPKQPATTIPTIDPSEVGEELDLEKAWHGVHFLLCGSAVNAPGPLGAAVLGGRELGEDLGYGPARYLEAAEVKAVAEALAGLTREQVTARFDADALEQAKVYPTGWSDDDDRRKWLAEACSELRAFYTSAAARGFAVLLYIL